MKDYLLEFFLQRISKVKPLWRASKGAFDAISDGTNITKSKPDPEVFLKASDFLQIEPAECLVVEDACAGIDAAKAGGMLAAGLGDAREYEKTDYLMETFSDLLRIAK